MSDLVRNTKDGYSHDAVYLPFGGSVGNSKMIFCYLVGAVLFYLCRSRFGWLNVVYPTQQLRSYRDKTLV